MNAEVVIKLKSTVKEEPLTEEVTTQRGLAIAVDMPPDKLQQALQTLVAQNITELIQDIFDEHPESIEAAKAKMQAEIAKTKKDEDAKTKTKKAETKSDGK